MKVVGLITEYNPFHNGHLYHIQQAKELTGADHVVVVMSGDYVQRGTPAIMPKTLRAEMALRCGASAVFSLPLCYATGSAELFSYGAVSLLHQLGVVTDLVFGSECNNLPHLLSLAEHLQYESKDFRHALKAKLREGMSFPRARDAALYEITGSETLSKILREPNNILGIEYLKALSHFDSDITPHTIQRKGAHYHDQSMHENMSSASAIRSLLAYTSSSMSGFGEEPSHQNRHFYEIMDDLDAQVPDPCLTLLKDYHGVKYPIYQNDFSLMLKYKLLNKTPENLVHYQDVSNDLAHRIVNNVNRFFNFKQFAQLLKTKELTHTRINRALLHIMLGTKKRYINEYKENGYHFYAHLLGVQKGKDALLSAISKQSALPLVSSISQEDALSVLGKRMLAHDTLATNLYRSVITNKFRTAFENEMSQIVIKV